MLAILALARRVSDTAPAARVSMDVISAVLTAAGLGLAVFGVLRSAEWGWVLPKPGSPSLLAVSPTLWLILGGLLTVWVFFEWEAHVQASGKEPLVRASIFAHHQMTGGLAMFFFFQYLVQAGLFFMIPLFLSVSLGRSALETGVRILPLSLTLLLARLACRGCLRRPRRGGWCGRGCWPCSRVWQSCWLPSTRTRPQRSSPPRCSWSASGSAPWPHSSGP